MAPKRPTGAELAARLEAITGHAFRDHGLMHRALTHSSMRGREQDDNERLEFLGDRVLGLLIAELLYRSLPDATQGELAVRLAALVSGETCGRIAEEVGLAALIRADAGVRRGAANQSRNVLADAVEALIAALYLEGGLEAARGFVLRHWGERASAAASMNRDPKTELQEWAARQNGARPVYEVAERSGPDHDPLFSVTVAVEGYAPAAGTGRSKRTAEQAAAAAMLRREGVWPQEQAA